MIKKKLHPSSLPGKPIQRMPHNIMNTIRLKILTISIAAFLLTLLLTPPSFSEDQGEKNLETKDSQELLALGQRIQSLFMDEDFVSVVSLIDQFFTAHSPTEANVGALLVQTQAYLMLDKKKSAIRSLEKAIPVLTKLDNIARRKYSHLYFLLGQLYSELRIYPKAISYVKDGLRLESQNIYNQIFLGELYKWSSKNALATSHFQSLLELSIITEEERFVIREKLRQIRPEEKRTLQEVDMAHAVFYEKIGYKIVPINHFGSQVNLYDICILLESKFRAPCEVREAIQLDENVILNTQRDQYDGNQIHNELLKRFPSPEKRSFFVIAVTDKDLFSKSNNYVFSWQNRRMKIGVVSTFRFLSGLDDFYEIDSISTRRLGIQFLSTVGSLHRFSRPISPTCPLAYPNDFQEFLNKGSKLCASTISQRDSTLKKIGGSGRRFTPQEIDKINQVYSKYHFK